MANVRNGTTYYIDTQYSSNEELPVKNIRIKQVLVTATSSNGRVVLADSGIATKIDLRVATSGETKLFDFSSNPIPFSTSIRPSTLSNAVVTCIVEETRG